MDLLLVDGRDLTFGELAVGFDLEGNDGCVPRRAAEAEPAVSTEIAHTVDDEPVLVQLHGAGDVRAVAEYDIRAGVDDGVGKGVHIAAVFTHEGLGALGHVLGVGALSAAVEGNDDDIRKAGELFHDPLGIGQIADVAGAAVGREGAKPVFDPVLFKNGVFVGAGQACVEDAGFLKVGLGLFAAFRAEVAGVVIGDADQVKTRVYVMLDVFGRGAEHIALAHVPAGLGRTAAVEERAFQIAEGDVGVFEDLPDVGQQVFAVVGGQVAGIGVIGAQHHIADPYDRIEGILRRGGLYRCGIGRRRGCRQSCRQGVLFIAGIVIRFAKGQQGTRQCEGHKEKKTSFAEAFGVIFLPHEMSFLLAHPNGEH